MKYIRNLHSKLSLTMHFVLFVFMVLMITCGIGFIIFASLRHFNVIVFSHRGNGPNIIGFHRFLLSVFAVCILIGTACTAVFGRKALKPVREVIGATHQVAKGNFDIQLHLKGIKEYEELSNSFNKMTDELASIETLRSNFVSNFSHEFKTPIVSIRGFAKLLKDGNLTLEEREEYLDIIMTESERLATLSTNVLTLSKYENIEILSDLTTFRLDEQIRRAIAIMDPKWSDKEMTINVGLDEVMFTGNADLTQQIWLNLMDNAIKFSSMGSRIGMTLMNIEEGIRFTIQDEGEGIGEIAKEHIFDKFYQGDTSHAVAGNGLGLTMVQRIVALHGGNICVESTPNLGTMFIVTMPNTMSKE